MTAPIVHPTAPRSDLACPELRIAPDADGSLTITPERTGWRYLTFRVVTLGAGETAEAGAPDREALVVPIAGGGAVVRPLDHPVIDLPDRLTPFDALPTSVYLPAGRPATISGRPIGAAADDRVTVAIAEAPATGRGEAATEPFVIGAGDLEIEIRGAGDATRQITKILRPESPADRLLVVEALTPSGNRSSWPPHKHDVDAMPEEAVLEEIYYYRFRRPGGSGEQRIYRGDRSRDCTFEVHTGECILVTDGYHPFQAAPDDDAWYLNALAGDRRTMACSFDPELSWINGTWASMATDPRIPMVTR